MTHLPASLIGYESNPFYGHDIFPNRLFQRQHHQSHLHDPFDLSTLGVIANLGGHHVPRRHDDLAPISTKKDAFEAHIDVGRFRPEELSVKVVNNCVIVEGKHEEREDDHHGYVTRHFMRRYEIPKDYDAEKIVSTLSSDGILTVRVPKPIQIAEGGEIVVPIQVIGPSKVYLQNEPKPQDAQKNEN